jgi:hypothetical protein
MSSAWPEDIMSDLSADTLAALKEFAAMSGVQIDNKKKSHPRVGIDAGHADEEEDEDDPLSILSSLKNHFQLPASERETTYPIHYETSPGVADRRTIDFTVKGIKRELGQTLDSTGLTMYVFVFLVFFRFCCCFRLVYFSFVLGCFDDEW